MSSAASDTDDTNVSHARGAAPRPPVAADPLEIRRALCLLTAPGQVVELRAIGVSTSRYRRPHIVSGYYDDLELLARDAARIAPLAKGTYVTLNPLTPALLARAANRVRDVDQRDSLTPDHEVVRRRWLPIDVDPRRPADISSTWAEHAAAHTCARELRAWLRARGWPEPIYADSGNGAHLLYRVDLPADDRGLLERVLRALAFSFDDDTVAIDQKVANPARIWKLYGTPVRKGDHLPERPHRLARLLEVPEVPAGVGGPASAGAAEAAGAEAPGWLE